MSSKIHIPDKRHVLDSLEHGKFKPTISQDLYLV